MTERPTKAYLPYLKTLRRLPADIVLSMATRNIQVGNPSACVCGWAIRESLAFTNGKPAEEYRVSEACDPWHQGEYLAKEYGGTVGEWDSLFYDASSLLTPIVEEAFLRRVAECVR